MTLWFWFIAAAMAAFIAWCVRSGKVPLRYRILADREADPKYYWFVMACLGVAEIALIGQALQQTISN